MIFKKSDNKVIREKPVKIAIGKILDQSFSFLFNQGLWFIAFGILCSLPYIPGLYDPSFEPKDLALAYFQIMVGLFEIFMGIILLGIQTLACRDWHLKAKISWISILCEAGQQFPRILGSTIMFILAAGFSSAFFVFPGLMVAMSYICTLPVLLIERLPISKSFHRSAKLTKGNRWRIFGLFIVSYFIVLSLTFCLNMVINVLIGMPWSSLIVHLLTPLLYALVGVSQVFLYYDLREKKEGLDLEVLSAQIPSLRQVAV